MRREKYEKRKKQLMSIFIIAVMVFAAVGFAASYISVDNGGADYEGQVFSQENGQYSTKIDGETVYFNYLPQQVADLELPLGAKEALSSKSLSVSYNPDSDFASTMAVAQYSIERAFPEEFGTYITKGVTVESDFALPVLTCEDATELSPVLVFDDANLTEITFENNCLIVGTIGDLDIYRFVDRLRYSLHGVMS